MAFASLIAVGSATASGASLDSRGTDFWLAFPQNYTGNAAQFSIFLSADEPTDVEISIPGLSFLDSVPVPAGETIKYLLPRDVEVRLYDNVSENGVNISSPVEVTVYGLNRQQYSTDAYLGLPSDVLGTRYFAMGWNGSLNGESQYLVTATEDNTSVQIIPSIYDNCPFDSEITLNKGQTFMHKSCADGDITGTEFIASAPVSVISGHECANIPTSITLYCDHILEQVPPTTAWGTQFLVTPLAERRNGDTFRFLASEDNTQIRINGTLSGTLAKGEFSEQLLETASFIEADKPILVAQYSNGTTFDSVVSDPFIMLVPPYEQFLDRYTFAAPTEGFRSNYVNVIVKSNQASRLLLDDKAITPDLFSPISNTDYVYAQVPLEPGSHSLSGAVAGIFVYGYDRDDSYGYPGGLSLSEVASVENVQLFDEYRLKEDEACFSARVSDLQNRGLPDVRVDFLIELIEGSDRSDEDGVAEFCVSAGDNPGEFNVRASVGQLTAEGSVTEAQVSEASGGGEVIVGGNDNGGSGGGGGCTMGGTGRFDPILPMMALFALMRIARRKNAA